MVRLPIWAAPASDSGMGHFRVSVEVGHPSGGRFVPLEALVDTGATYTWIPRDVLADLGVAAERWRRFLLAGGREVRYPVAWIRIKIGEGAQPTIVVFGEPGSEPILGVVTMEEFLLAPDPVSRRLIPVPGLLKEAELVRG
jgi:aspartyl protease family protein